MLTQYLPLHLAVASLCCSFLLAGCATQDNDLGKDSEADGGTDAKVSDVRALTCEQDGKTYQVGESVALSVCTTCVCQQDGTVGRCTGLCAPDAAAQTDTVVTCTQNGQTYPVGARVGSGCASCACLADGTWGMCMGDCPPDAATQTDVAVTCTQNGGTYRVGETVTLSACTTCVCQPDGTLGLCTGLCPPDAATQHDATVTCTQNGQTYPVGARVGSGCASCACLADGTWGMCTGDCPPDAGTPDAAGTCTQDGKTYPVGTRVGSGCVSCACLADGTWGQCTGACPPDAGQPDTDPAPVDYTCRDDSDCCIIVDTCINHAYLYSIAPGASGLPVLPPSGTCNRCVPPAVQVRCELGQCVGTELSDGTIDGQLRQDHCGLIGLADAGARLYTPAYAGAQPTSWGC